MIFSHWTCKLFLKILDLSLLLIQLVNMNRCLSQIDGFAASWKRWCWYLDVQGAGSCISTHSEATIAAPHHLLHKAIAGDRRRLAYCTESLKTTGHHLNRMYTVLCDLFFRFDRPHRGTPACPLHAQSSHPPNAEHICPPLLPLMPATS